MRLLLAALGLCAIASCVQTSNKGCTEYKPVCMMGGRQSCAIDAKGCEVCSCLTTQEDGLIVPDHTGDPYGGAPISRP